METDDRFTCLNKLDNKLIFLLDVQKLEGLSSGPMKEICGNLAIFYDGDIKVTTCMLKFRSAKCFCWIIKISRWLIQNQRGLRGLHTTPIRELACWGEINNLLGDEVEEEKSTFPTLVFFSFKWYDIKCFHLICAVFNNSKTQTQVFTLLLLITHLIYIYIKKQHLYFIQTICSYYMYLLSI